MNGFLKSRGRWKSGNVDARKRRGSGRENVTGVMSGMAGTTREATTEIANMGGMMTLIGTARGTETETTGIATTKGIGIMIETGLIQGIVTAIGLGIEKGTVSVSGTASTSSAPAPYTTVYMSVRSSMRKLSARTSTLSSFMTRARAAW